MTKVFPAATVVLLRDQQNKDACSSLEVLLLCRSAALSFAGDCWVFPGGRIDREDYGRELNDIGAAARRGAVRETLEEAGLAISATELVYFAHRTTPAGRSRRFATWFYIAIAENEQAVTVDGGEIVDHCWSTPLDVLEQYSRRAVKMMPPTVMILSELLDCKNAAQALAVYKNRSGQLHMPTFTITERGIVMQYPDNAVGDPEGQNTQYLLEERWRENCES